MFDPAFVDGTSAWPRTIHDSHVVFQIDPACKTYDSSVYALTFWWNCRTLKQSPVLLLEVLCDRACLIVFISSISLLLNHVLADVK